MKTQHTPGPWKIDIIGNPDDNIIFIKGVNPRSQFKDEIHLCKMSGSYVDEIEANARLIAAAPELLQACQYAFECLSKLQINTGDLGDQAYQALESAIKKAKGE